MSISAKSPVIMDATEMMKGLKPEDLKALLKGKIAEGMHQNASPYVQKRINALKHVQVKMLETEANFYDELHELELKYAKIYEPMYEKRRTIVSGEYTPTQEESEWTLDEQEEQGANITELDAEETEKGIKNFWLETLQSFRITSEIIQEYDEEILGYLQDVQVKLFSEKPYGYTLEFYFSENPFFTNTVLTKTYVLKTVVDPASPFEFDGPDLEKATGCTINWKEGKNVCMKMVKKKLKPRNKKQPPKVVTKEEKQDSFFNFFETPKLPAKNQAAKKSESEADEEEDDDMHDQELYLIADFEIGQYLKEKIIPKAILFFTGEGVDDEFEDEDYDEEDEEDEEDEDEGDEDDEEDDDDDEEDEDEDEEAPKKGKKASKKAGGKPGKNGEPTPSECKQN